MNEEIPILPLVGTWLALPRLRDQPAPPPAAEDLQRLRQARKQDRPGARAHGGERPAQALCAGPIRLKSRQSKQPKLGGHPSPRNLALMDACSTNGTLTGSHDDDARNL